LITSLKNTGIYAVAAVLSIGVNIYSWHLPFFWDTILTSTITQHFYENGFHNFITPSTYDAGHPPLFYIYVTLFFKWFGKNLFASHLSMLPFTFLGIFSFIKILEWHEFSFKDQFIGVVLFFSIPAVLTQYTMVSYDAVLLSLYLSALACFLYNRKLFFSFVLILMVGISIRGLVSLASLSITIYFFRMHAKRDWLKWMCCIVPAIALAIGWYFYHHAQAGWFISTNAEGWAAHRGLVNLKELIKNGFSITRCLFDYSIIVLILLAVLYAAFSRKLNSYTFIWLVPAVTFSSSFLPFTNPINHRYYLIVYVLLLPAVLRLLSKKNIRLSVMVIVLLVSGHFMIYPGKISNGWDCTLAHQPYFKLKNSLEVYLKEHSILHNEVGTVFPMIASKYQTDLVSDKNRMVNVNGMRVDSIEYILYSNIGNDFSDEQLDKFQQWHTLKEERSGLVKMVLLQNPHFPRK
jgi:hypothetical protein